MNRLYIQFEMSHTKSMNPINLPHHISLAQINLFEKAVMNNMRQSIEKHIPRIKMDQNQLNSALFRSIDNFRIDEDSQECFLLLLRHKANPNCQISNSVRISDGVTPLIAACRKGELCLVKHLIQYGAKPELCPTHQSALEVVLFDRRENFDVAQVLINALPSVNIEIKGQPPLVVAVQREFLRIFQLLIEKGANLVFEDENILHIIARKKFRKVEKKKKFIKQLSGRAFLIQEDCHSKLPFDYEENQEIKLYCLQVFRARTKPELALTSKTKLDKVGKVKESDGCKDSRKKNKDLDISFSEFDEEEWNDYREHVQREEKLSEVIEVFDEDEVLVRNKEVREGGTGCQEIREDRRESKAESKTQIRKQREQARVLTSKIDQQAIPLTKKPLKTTLETSKLKKSTLQPHKIKKLQDPPKRIKRTNSELSDDSIGSTVKSIQSNPKLTPKDKPIEKQKQDKIHSSVEPAPKKLLYESYEQISQRQSESSDEEYNNLDNLNHQILRFTDQITEECLKKAQKRNEMIAYLQLIINEAISIKDMESKVQIFVYGSYSTGLAIPDSDVDLLVFSHLECLFIMDFLENNKTFNIKEIATVKFIKGATMPVVKMEMSDHFDKFRVDLTFQTRQHMGLKCSEFVTEFVQTEVLLRPLVLFIKTLVCRYKLSDPYTGGIGSYSITLLVMALLQSTSKPRTLELIGEFLLDFFHFYGNELQYISEAIIVYLQGYTEYPAYTIFRFPTPSSLTPKLVIYDPLNPVNIVSRSSYRIISIKKLFSLCYIRLESGHSLLDLLDGNFLEIIDEQ